MKLTFGKLIIFAHIVASWPAVADSSGHGETPPPGERVYSIDWSDKFAPAEINAADQGSAKGHSTLKDPNFDVHKVAPKPLKAVERPKKPKAPVVVQQKPKKKVMQFNRLAVRGRLKEPRVKFGLDRLPIPPSEQPTENDFLHRVYETEGDRLK